jgi:hypothetical protein
VEGKASMRSRDGSGWLAGDEKERKVELGAVVPMATGRVARCRLYARGDMAPLL